VLVWHALKNAALPIHLWVDNTCWRAQRPEPRRLQP